MININNKPQLLGEGTRKRPPNLFTKIKYANLQPNNWTPTIPSLF